MKKKVYKAPPPKAPGPLPSAEYMDSYEKKLREAAGAYYEAYPTKGSSEEEASKLETWLSRKRPGILKRFREMTSILLPPGSKHKKPL